MISRLLPGRSLETPRSWSFPRDACRSAAVLVAGWLLIATSIVLLLRAGLGMAPYDVLNTGLANRLDMSPGTASWLACGALVLIALTMRSRPGIGTLLGAFAVGALINAGLDLVPTVDVTAQRYALLAFSLLPQYLGVCCIILSRGGKGPVELVTVGLMHKGMPLRHSRWLVEAACLLVGALLGGSIGVGTVLQLVASGPAIAALLPFVSRATGLRTVPT
jgi:uncharacterized membrane protein YczE